MYRNYPLEKLNSFRVKVKASLLATVNNVRDVYSLLSSPFAVNNEILVLGAGNNILFTKDFMGLVIKNEIKGIVVLREDNNNVWVKVGAGEDWDDFVDFCVENNYYGAENLAYIPGTVGAAPIQNIGAYGVEAKDIIEKVDFIHFDGQKAESIGVEECAFGYRDSIFKNELKKKVIITAVTFKLNKKAEFNIEYGSVKHELEKYPEINLKNIQESITNIRKCKLPEPEELGNAGSFFKNPQIDNELFCEIEKQYPGIPNYPQSDGKTKIPAGWLIEQTGWKGRREEKVGMHETQALVLVNYGGASGTDLINHAFAVRKSVFDKFGIELEIEVNIL